MCVGCGVGDINFSFFNRKHRSCLYWKKDVPSINRGLWPISCLPIKTKKTWFLCNTENRTHFASLWVMCTGVFLLPTSTPPSWICSSHFLLNNFFFFFRIRREGQRVMEKREADVGGNGTTRAGAGVQRHSCGVPGRWVLLCRLFEGWGGRPLPSLLFAPGLPFCRATGGSTSDVRGATCSARVYRGSAHA